MAASTLAASSLSTQSQLQSDTTNTPYLFPTYTHFPPFYDLQPNLTTRARQIELWSQYLLSYSTFHKLFRLQLSSPPADLFTNKSINRTLKPSNIRILLDELSKPANGSVVEWIPATKKEEQSQACYVWWRSAQEWADALYAWVEETGQKGTVLTLYELREGDAVRGMGWRDMDEGMLRRVLGVLVKRGKAQVFGQEAGEGVKFF